LEILWEVTSLRIQFEKNRERTYSTMELGFGVEKIFSPPPTSRKVSKQIGNSLESYISWDTI